MNYDELLGLAANSIFFVIYVLAAAGMFVLISDNGFNLSKQNNLYLLCFWYYVFMIRQNFAFFIINIQRSWNMAFEIRKNPILAVTVVEAKDDLEWEENGEGQDD